MKWQHWTVSSCLLPLTMLPFPLNLPPACPYKTPSHNKARDKQDRQGVHGHFQLGSSAQNSPGGAATVAVSKNQEVVVELPGLLLHPFRSSLCLCRINDPYCGWALIGWKPIGSRKSCKLRWGDRGPITLSALLLWKPIKNQLVSSH